MLQVVKENLEIETQLMLISEGRRTSIMVHLTTFSMHAVSEMKYFHFYSFHRTFDLKKNPKNAEVSSAEVIFRNILAHFDPN